MASFVFYPADLGPPVVLPLDRRIVRLGTAPDNDLVLVGGGALPHHAHVVYDKQTFTLSASDGEASFQILGKPKKTHKLQDKDLVQIGEHLLRFVAFDHDLKPRTEGASPAPADLQRFVALHRFAQKLMGQTTLQSLFEALLDELIALTGADKAFLLLALGGQAKVHVARNIDNDPLVRGDEAISDSIVGQVLDSGEPLIVADALSHEVFR